MWLRRPLFYLSVCMLLNSAESVNYSHHILLAADGMYYLYWNPPESKSGDSLIAFKVEVEAKGCIALGFSSDGQISGSDIVTGWIEDEEVHFQDQHIDASGILVKDDQQDYELINAYKNETFSVFEFRRKLDTCDEKDVVINEGTIRVISSYSPENPSSDGQCNLENQGVKSVILLQRKTNEDLNLDFDSLLQWSITSPDVDISNIDMLHWCKIFEAPEISEKHHIVYVKPLIQEGHEQFIHYMMLYECTGGPREGFEHYLDDKGSECFAPQMPIEMGMCEILSTIWVAGQKDFVLPENVGMPMDPDPPKFYRFEIYYENPQRQSGIIDHSGLMIYYTENLREFETGNFLIGANILPRLFIPPGQEEYYIVGHSSPECIGSSLPESGVKFLAVFLHSHLIGRGMKVRHFRGNEELIPLADEKNHDIHYPMYRFFTEEVGVLPNDQISVECRYDSSERSNVTLGGISLADEMCHIMILYYPRVDESTSMSLPTYDTIKNILNSNLTNEEDASIVLSSYDWSRADIDEVQDAIRYSGHEIQCTLGPIQEKVVTTFVTYPSDLVPYETDSTCSTV